MLSTLLRRIHVPRALLTDLPVIVSLVGLDVAARLLPHAPGFTPVAATALFAASVVRVRALSILVPLIGLLLGDALLGFYDLRVMAVVYGTLVLPACAAWAPRRLRRPGLIVPVLLTSSLTFFLVTNAAVWAFTPMYAPNWTGLIECYVAALPFLQNMAAGDLFWGLALFATYRLVQSTRAAKAAAPHAVALAA